ncbi:hypothetical protein F0P96_10615 [Hymenobacter busanensis]|uniref:Uncharacterized protein n=1 Tax=Hymenobacter busanensis TaxID=2607656 RepID=A0A7L4ZXZ5_9BACT|nr:hypothetical protein [Hymenobacter busanensis]KAA9333413.1 hypothetical protein F0P96_10615 [Hymenobacter busanensis]QHJ07907.1 hypothetical protein GUY19_11690 [Hymenobacter busanensis]
MLNPHTFPFAAAGRPLPDAELPACAEQPYSLPAPADRFLPFCLTRPANPARRLDCARVVRADTGAVLVTLSLTGGTYPLDVEKRTDGQTDYFLYYGAIVPGLSLPCGIPLRLVVDEFTSVRFSAIADLSGYLLLEWYHDGPLAGIPYGAGMRQRLYVEAGALRFGPPRQDIEETQDKATGTKRTDFLALTRTATFTVPPAASYLVQAVHAARAHRYFEAGGLPLAVTDTKQSDFGTDVCRWTLDVTVEDVDVLVARGCPAPLPVLDVAPYTPRPYVCGDTSDVAPDWQRKHPVETECEQDAAPEWRRKVPFETQCEPL